jgi:hypothetical protein
MRVVFILNLFLSFFVVDIKLNLLKVTICNEARSGALFEALRYKPEGRGIDFRWCQWNFSLT